MAVPTVVYSDAVSLPSADTGDTLTFSHWGSIQADDLIILLVSNEDGDPVQWTGSGNVSEAGYTFMYSDGTNGSDTIGAFYKVASGSESGDFTVTSVSATEYCGSYIVLRGVDTADPFNALGTPNTADTDVFDVDEIITDEDDCLVIVHSSLDGADFGTFVYSGTGWFYGGESAQRPGNAFSPSMSWGTKVMASADNTGVATITTDVVDGRTGVQFAFKGAAAGGGDEIDTFSEGHSIEELTIQTDSLGITVED